MDKIRKEAQRIIEHGNGFGVPCSELLKIKNETERKEIWKEIIKIGQEQDKEKENYFNE